MYFYCINILAGGQAQWRTQQINVLKPISKVRSKNIYRQSAGVHSAGISEGKAKSKGDVFSSLLKVAVEGADRTKRGSLFHRVGPQERKALAPLLVLILGTEC